MSSVCGVTCPLSITFEKFVNFNEFKNHDFYLLSVVHSQKWDNYFNMLNGPIYHALIREFWTNVSLEQLRHDASCIQSNILEFSSL